MDKWKSEDYQILKTLGSGGHGDVYLAQKKKEKLKLSRLFAIKEFNKKDVNLEDFTNEVEILSTLNHQNICHIYDAYETELNFNILMEYIEGCTLKEFGDEIAKKNIVFGIGESLQIIEPIMSALIYAHDHESGQILHKDICTSNIMISKTGKVTLIDFGIGQFGNEENKVLRGKPAFLPELVIHGKAPYTTATDFYSLGVVAYSLLSGHRIRKQAEIDLDKITENAPRDLVNLLLNFDGDYQGLIQKIEDAQVEYRGQLRKVCKQVFDKQFKGEKKIIPKNIFKFSILNFFGFLELFKDEEIVEINQTIKIERSLTFKKRKLVAVLIALTPLGYAFYKLFLAS
jgi:serine/threonine protein kinase